MGWLDKRLHPDKKNILELLYDLMHHDLDKSHSLMEGMEVVGKFNQLKQIIEAHHPNKLTASIKEFTLDESEQECAYVFHYMLFNDKDVPIMDNHCFYGAIHTSLKEVESRPLTNGAQYLDSDTPDEHALSLAMQKLTSEFRVDEQGNKEFYMQGISENNMGRVGFDLLSDETKEKMNASPELCAEWISFQMKLFDYISDSHEFITEVKLTAANLEATTGTPPETWITDMDNSIKKIRSSLEAHKAYQFNHRPPANTTFA
ncbi:MAG: hypothetical protein ACRC5A_07760 [Enterobacteriaceae bacterium]